jgi:hypothetical protein
MKKATFITVSHADYLGTLLEDASAGGESNWTLSRHARPGDRVLLYLKAPVSAIVAWGRVSSIPIRLDDPSEPWHGHFCADLEALAMTPARVTRESLRAAFPEWRYWKQPRQSVRVPAGYEPLLLKMVESGRMPWEMPCPDCAGGDPVCQTCGGEPLEED